MQGTTHHAMRHRLIKLTAGSEIHWMLDVGEYVLVMVQSELGASSREREHERDEQDVAGQAIDRVLQMRDVNAESCWRYLHMRDARGCKREEGEMRSE